MPTIYTAVRGTANAQTENVRVRDVSPALQLLEPDEGPLTTIMAKFRKVRVFNPQVEWFEDELLPRFDTLSADLTAGAATMTVNNYQRFRSGDLVKINNVEVIRVGADPTSSTVTITRAVGTTSAQAAVSGNNLFIMSNSTAENAAAPSLLSTQKVRQFNYAQIIRDPFGHSQTAIDSKTYGGDDPAFQRRKFLLEHKRKIENALIHGERYEDTSGTQYQHSTSGCLAYIISNVQDMAGETTEAEFEDWIRRNFRFGSKNKLLFSSPVATSVINGFGRDKIRLAQGEKTYGITMSEYQNAGRKVMIVEHNQLSNDLQTDITGIAGYVICLDINDLELCHMGEVLTRFKENIQANNIDGVQNEYRSQISLRLWHERKHGLAKGITS